MSRSQAVAVENNFQKALITEASALNFPENACTETYDCHFEYIGRVKRRKGFDFESGYSVKTIDRTGGAVSTYLWRNVAGDGNITLFIAQIGSKLYGWDISNTTAVSPGAFSSTVDLTSFKPSGAPDPKTSECQFSDGNGYLFVTHATLEPFYVSYDSATQTLTATAITLQIRDFAGLTEAGVEVDNRPFALTTAHSYNLRNQGWTFSTYAAFASTTSVTPGTGSKGAFTVSAGGPWVANDPVYAWGKDSYQGNKSSVYHYIQGVVASYSGTSLTITSSAFNGTSAVTDWQFGSRPDYIQIFQGTIGQYPSNADVWWLFKDSGEEFNPKKTIVNVNRGTTPAPKGHFILSAFNQDRSTVSGVAGISNVTSSYYRPTTSAFHAGRVFYAGTPYTGFSGNIYFSQIIEPGTTNFGYCYQRSDPTDETLFDLLPSDGGVIVIPEAGSIHKLWSMQGGLVVFASNGVWLISGSTGVGFTATDYTRRRISTIKCISATSFIDIGGYPAWWVSEGIYIIQPSQDGISLQSLTDQSIFSFYRDIPLASKKQARGYFNLVTRQAQWVYRSTQAGTVEETYEYDRILTFNTKSAAMFPWTISASTVKIHGLVVPDLSGGTLSEISVVDDSAVTVVDDLGATVTVYDTVTSTAAIPTMKYFCSYATGGSYAFTFCEEANTNYLDFYTYDTTGVDYVSYFITGFKVHGQGNKKFQSNWVTVFTDEIPSRYGFQAIWNWANTGNSGEFSSRQIQVIENTNYNVRWNRLKIRGEGLALQFKVTSVSGQPFSLIGWAGFETGNSIP